MEDIVTIADVVKNQQACERALNRIISKGCSYDEGYVRQDLFYCADCSRGHEDEPVGFCKACSLACHAAHDVKELYAKRAFRCDCGNARAGNNGAKCTQKPDKDPVNEGNKYNHNFRGLYCSCDRPYDEDAEQETMLQCYICEDWFHESCLRADGSGPIDADAAQAPTVVCKKCAPSSSILRAYAISNDGSNAALSETETPKKCPLEGGAIAAPEKSTPFVLSDGWRDRLCDCDGCRKVAHDANLGFVFDAAADVEEGEDEDEDEDDGADDDAKAPEAALDAQLAAALHDMPPEMQVELAAGYRDMAEAFKAKFEKISREGGVVVDKDIEDVIQNLREIKRRRLD
eukprot:Opistho-2@69540